MNEVSTNQAYRFAGFTLDPARAALLRDGEEIPLRQRTFEVLTHLVRNSGRLVSKQELFEAVWRDVAVTDDSLVQCLVEIRKALGDEQHRVRRYRPSAPRAQSYGLALSSANSVSEPLAV